MTFMSKSAEIRPVATRGLVRDRRMAPSAAKIEEAAKALREGQLVAFPTETVYGLGADATNEVAVAKIFAAQGRPQFNPLITHIANPHLAEEYAQIEPAAKKLMDAFWPGSLTLVLPRSERCPIVDLVSAGLDTIAVRMPAHPVAQALIHLAGRPIAAPSANKSGHVSATTAAHVKESLESSVDLILDDGPCTKGIESTIVKVDGDQVFLLRPGCIARDDIVEIVGPLAEVAEPGVEAPGQLESHYATSASLRLNATSVAPHEGLLAFGALDGLKTKHTLNLSPSEDLIEAAANLFAHLRNLDKTGCDTIAVMPIPSHGLGEAINDRLTRAAAPRRQDPSP